MPQNPNTHENHYGGLRRHSPEHDERILENFTDDNQDFKPNGAEYNDSEETRFAKEDRLAHDHHDRPEPASRDGDFAPSIYSDGGHGRMRTQAPQGPENADNKDYAMNKDSERGAQQKYADSDKTDKSVESKKSWWSRFIK